jgi:hypothetical protein
MKQNKRFILLVAIVLLASCLFAGLASAADVQNVYVRPTHWDGKAGTSMSSYVKTVSAGYISDGKVTADGTVYLRIVDAGNSTYDVTSVGDSGKDGLITVAYTFPAAETQNKVFYKVTTADSTKVSVAGANTKSASLNIGAYSKADDIALKIVKSAGTTVTVTLAGSEADLKTSAAKEVKVAISAAAIAPKNLSIAVKDGVTPELGKTYGLSDLFVVSSTTTNADTTVTLTSSDTSKAFISEQKDITLLAEGKVTITATSTLDSKVTAKVEFEVKKPTAEKPVTKISFTQDPIDWNTYKTSFKKEVLSGGKAASGTVEGLYEDITGVDLVKYMKVEPTGYTTPAKIAWSVDDPDIAGVKAVYNWINNKNFTKALVYKAANGKNGKVTVTVTMTNNDGSEVSGKVVVDLSKKIGDLQKVSLSPSADTHLYYVDKDT